MNVASMHGEAQFDSDIYFTQISKLVFRLEDIFAITVISRFLNHPTL